MTGLSDLALHSRGTAALVVGKNHTAVALGSGTIEVFATPAMVALMEAAAVDCVERSLPQGMTSLGTHIDVSHVAPTPIGKRVEATAELLSVDGRVLKFALEARDEAGIIGRGTHTRAVVDRERFEAKLAGRTSVRS